MDAKETTADNITISHKEPEWLGCEKTCHWNLGNIQTHGGAEWIIAHTFGGLRVGPKIGKGANGTVYADCTDPTLCHKFTYIDKSDVDAWRAWLDRLVSEQPVWYCGVRSYEIVRSNLTKYWAVRIDLNRLSGTWVDMYECGDIQHEFNIRYGDLQGMQLADGTIRIIDGDPSMTWP